MVGWPRSSLEEGGGGWVRDRSTENYNGGGEIDRRRIREEQSERE